MTCHMDVDGIRPENNELELANEDTVQDPNFISSSTDYLRVDYKSVAASSLLKLITVYLNRNSYSK